MIYLSSFHFATEEAEWRFFVGFQRTCYDSFYPFQIFPQRGLHELDLADITILYGGNGSGKTTALNVMAETLRLRRGASFNGTSFFKPYCQLCSPHLLHPLPPDSCILTSDDVFDTMLDMRAINEGVDRRRDELLAEAKEARNAHFQMRSLEDYDRLKQVAEARRTSQSRYARRRVMPNVRTRSNGESAFLFFTEKIRSGALYLLDEPENSLSPRRQMELAQFLQESARFYNCQFVLATHSPFLLAMPGARVYDLDSDPVQPRRWTELENVRAYYDFFKEHEEEF
ncbi:AAA family ATPase [Gemmiger formicilis]|uniref:AAA family ATPase n=1 Tax=Gemmiger formicilis TaxID=745368 RepID=UPI0019589360|nr:AAA family ATPase [Gemmiger formicilis]MBM6717867.1 AAA family ATPase [Gemmiger formicilis]